MRSFGHVERMTTYRMDRRVLKVEIIGVRVESTEVRLDGWCELVLGSLGMTVEAA